MKKTEEIEERTVKAIGLFLAVAIIALSAVFLYSPVFKTHASKSYIENGKNKVSARLQTMIAMNFSTEKLSFEMNPVSGGSFKSLPINVSVTTNDPTGYQIYMSALDGVDLTSSATTDKVTSITESATSSDMPVNTWGYSVDNTTFHAIPASDNPALIAQVFERTQNSLTTINYGVKVDNNLDMAKYTDTLVLTAVAYNAGRDECGDGFFCIEYMQDMTPEICAATPTPDPTAYEFTPIYMEDEDTLIPRVTLTDKRDGKEYVVTKLADGNCWMHQNLEFQLDDSVALTNELTDLNSRESWTPGHSTSYIEQPEERPSTFGTPSDPEWDKEADNKEYSVKVKFQTYVLDETGWPVYDNNNYPSFEWIENTLYTWSAASAGGNMSNEKYNTGADSICPRGWQIPNHKYTDYYENGYTISDKSYEKLIDTYKDTDASSVPTTPLNFTHTGYYSAKTYQYPDGAIFLANPGRLWFYWANGSEYTDSIDYLLYEDYYHSQYVGTLDFNSSTYSNMDAYAIRCVAR